MKVTISIDPESTAYIFDNAFHYEWFRDARVPDREPAIPSKWDTEHTAAACHAAVGGTVEIEALDPTSTEETAKWFTVKREDFERAYAQCLTDGGRHLSDLLEGSADVNACDCWLQYAVFGKLVYG